MRSLGLQVEGPSSIARLKTDAQNDVTDTLPIHPEEQDCQYSSNSCGNDDEHVVKSI